MDWGADNLTHHSLYAPDVDKVYYIGGWNCITFQHSSRSRYRIGQEFLYQTPRVGSAQNENKKWKEYFLQAMTGLLLNLIQSVSSILFVTLPPLSPFDHLPLQRSPTSFELSRILREPVYTEFIKNVCRLRRNFRFSFCRDFE